MRNPIDPPVSGVQKPILSSENLEFLYRSICAIPACVHPEILKSNVFPGDLINQAQACGCLHSAPCCKRNGQNDWLPVVLGRVISQDVASQDVMSVDIVSIPRQQQNFWSSNLLTGMQREMCRPHAGGDRDGPFCWTRKVDGPGTRPSQGPDQATPSRLNVEERYCLTRFAATFT